MLKEIYKYFNQTLHYCHKFNDFIVHHEPVIFKSQ